MTTKANDQASEVLRYFQSDRAARERLGVNGPHDLEFIAASESLVRLASRGKADPGESLPYAAELTRLLSQNSDGRAETLAERSLSVLRQIGGIDSARERSLQRAIYAARAKRLVTYFDKMTTEEGEVWRSNLESAWKLLQLVADESASRSDYDGLLAALASERHRQGSGFAELFSTCKGAQQLVVT